MEGDWMDMKKQRDHYKRELERFADFHEWLTDVYMNDGTTLTELFEEYEKYEVEQESPNPTNQE